MFVPLGDGNEKGPERLAQGLMFWMNMVLICVSKCDVSGCVLYRFLITHDPQPASRADMASEGLPRLHA
ncbi:hypothetical protein ACV1CZ_22090, partial [Aeromonas caviae]